MYNCKTISYALSAAVTLSLCASISAQEVATHSLDAAEKVLLMETINVTSDKEIAEENLTSGDPEVDQILSLVDSLTTISDNPNEDTSNAEPNTTSSAVKVDSTSAKANSSPSKNVANDDETVGLDSAQSEALDTDSTQISE